jgi:hypothetical protein
VTAAGTPVDALDRVLARTCHLLVEFDGPVRSLFAGTPTAPIAARLRAILTREGVGLPPAIAAPLHYRLLVSREPVTEQDADRSAAAALAAAAAGVFASAWGHDFPTG